jgi:salicylate hydroxylase
MSVQGRQITVLGGGIGGLAAGLALAQRGARVRVLEQAEAITEVGAGIQVSPNGLRVLEALGLASALAGRAPRARAVSLRDGPSGREVLRLDLGRLPEGQVYRFVHRADLVEVLAEAARDAGVRIRLLQRAVSVTPGRPARIAMGTGDVLDTDMVIAADGLRSVARPALNGTAAPAFTGQVAWRAVVANRTGHPAEARVHMGPGRHLVSYPLRDGGLVNLVAVEERAAWAEEGWSRAGDPAEMRAAFAGFGGDVPALLAAVEHAGFWGLFRHPVARAWHGPGLALVGDAAHPTLPFLAQGANMALEDAWVLAACLDSQPDEATALGRYQALRRDRVVRVIAAADGNAWKYHLRNPLVRRGAHLAMSALGRTMPDRMMRGFDWLYGHDVTRGA